MRRSQSRGHSKQQKKAHATGPTLHSLLTDAADRRRCDVPSFESPLPLPLLCDLRITYQEDQKIADAGTFTLLKEDHTLGNIIRMSLLADGRVLFAGYRMPHPLENRMVIKVKTRPGYRCDDAGTTHARTEPWMGGTICAAVATPEPAQTRAPKNFVHER